MADQLVTLAQVKRRLSIDVGDTGDDTVLTEMIEQVSDWIQHYTGRKFVPENAATYVFDTEAGYGLRVPRGIRNITSLGVNSLSHQPDAGGSYTTISAANILLRDKIAGDGPYGAVRLSRASSLVFSTVENGATITGNFGFATTPPDIQAVCLDAVSAAYGVRKMGAGGVIGEDGIPVPPWSQFFTRGSPQRGTLDRYRYWGVG